MHWILISIILFLFLIYASLLIIYRLSFKKTPIFKISESGNNSTVSVSIIIPARNEAANIERCLNSILANSYPSLLLEIIVIDDHSTDTTSELAKACSPLVKIISLANYISSPINSYKKMAIEIAIKQSKGELIICTDADCVVPHRWIQTIVSFYKLNKSAFIAMPVCLLSNNSFLEKFQVVDFMVLQGITAGAVNSKMHPMCNGANLAYTKEAFNAVNGFEGVTNIASGDDMLLMQKIARAFPENVHYLKSEEVLVSTTAQPNLKSFLQQRIRWASKAGFYKNISLNIILVIVYLFNLILFALPIIAVFYNPQIIKSTHLFNLNLLGFWVCLILLKISFDLFLFYPVAIFFKRKNLLSFFILAQPFHIIYTVIAGWMGKFGTYQWKGRNVK